MALRERKEIASTVYSYTHVLGESKGSPNEHSGRLRPDTDVPLDVHYFLCNKFSSHRSAQELDSVTVVLGYVHDYSFRTVCCSTLTCVPLPL